jgi:site-specific recombinase XerD
MSMVRSQKSIGGVNRSSSRERTLQDRRSLDVVREVIRLKHYSYRTEQTYLDWIKRYLLDHDKKYPRDMGAHEIQDFLTHLAVDRQVSASTQNQALSALLFLYRSVLQVELGDISTFMRAKRRKRLPTVLTKDEVSAIMLQRKLTELSESIASVKTKLRNSWKRFWKFCPITPSCGKLSLPS